MTKLPSESWDVTPLKGEMYPDYKVGPICCVPRCSRFVDHTHHLWRRSFMGGAYSWVRLGDGTVVGNIVGICWKHHELVTDNRATITFINGVFYWCTRESPYPDAGNEITPQPPFQTRVTSNGGLVNESHVAVGHDSSEHVSNEHCPTCHQRIKPKIKTPTEEKRPRASWNITVPMDKRENGAEVLDTLLESARVALDTAGIGYEDKRGVRYFVLATTLGLFVQHAEEILGDS